MRRRFPNLGAWEMQLMKEPELEGVLFQEAKAWLAVSDQELDRLIDEGVLNVAEICDGTGAVVRSLVRTMDIRNLLAKRKVGLK